MSKTIIISNNVSLLVTYRYSPLILVKPHFYSAFFLFLFFSKITVVFFFGLIS